MSNKDTKHAAFRLLGSYFSILINLDVSNAYYFYGFLKKEFDTHCWDENKKTDLIDKYIGDTLIEYVINNDDYYLLEDENRDYQVTINNCRTFFSKGYFYAFLRWSSLYSFSENMRKVIVFLFPEVNPEIWWKLIFFVTKKNFFLNCPDNFFETASEYTKMGLFFAYTFKKLNPTEEDYPEQYQNATNDTLKLFIKIFDIKKDNIISYIDKLNVMHIEKHEKLTQNYMELFRQINVLMSYNRKLCMG